MSILASTVAEGVARPAISGALVYRKSSRGVVKLAAIDGGQLSSLERHLLIMVDGRRTLAELSELFGAEKLKLLSLLAELEAKGLVKRVDPSAADLGGAITQFGAAAPEAGPATRTRDRTPLPGAQSARDRPLRRDAPTPPRFYPPAVITPRREPAPAGLFSVDEHPLAWFVLVLVVTIACSNWLAHRIHSELKQNWWSDYKPAQPIDPYSGPISSGIVGGGRSDRPPSIETRPGSDLTTASPTVSAQRIPPNPPAPIKPNPPAHVASNPAARVALNPQAHVAPNPAGRAVSRLVPQVHPAASTPAPSVAQTPAAETAATSATGPDTAEPASDTQVASAKPAPQTGEMLELRPLRHDPPRIPAKAVHDGIVEGHAQVRLWITPEGKVDEVDVLEASPRGVLDDEVKRVLSLWTFEPPGHPVDEVVQLTLEP